MVKYLHSFIICITLLASIYSMNREQEIIKNYHTYCDDIDEYTDIDTFKHKLDDYRYDRDNQYYDNYDEIVKALPQDGNKRIIKTTLAPFILLIIYGSFVFIILILYLLIFLGVIKCQQKRFCFILAILLVISLIACFIVGIILALESKKGRDKAYCYLYKIQVNAIVGNITDGSDSYIGFRNLALISGSILKDLPKMQQNLQIYQQLIQAGFVQRFAPIYESLQNFVNRNSQIKTQNAFGNLQVPFSNLNLPPVVNAAIETEFNKMYHLSSGLSQLAMTGLKLQNQQYYQGMTQLLQKQNQAFTKVEQLLNKTFLENNHFAKLDKHILKAGRTTVYPTIGVIVFFSIAIILSCFKKTQKIAILVMMFACLVLLLVCIAFIIWNFGVAEVSGLCGIARELNTGNVNIIKEIGGSDDILSFVESCIASTAKNDFITKNIQDPAALGVYYDYENYINTLILYRSFIQSNKVKSQNIEDQQNQWLLVSDGINYDHPNVEDQLHDFNDSIDCSDQTYGLTTQSCSNRCQSIFDTISYNPPQCVNQKRENELMFTQLKQYIVDTRQNAQRLIQESGYIQSDEFIRQIELKQQQDFVQEKQQIQQAIIQQEQQMKQLLQQKIEEQVKLLMQQKMLEMQPQLQQLPQEQQLIMQQQIQQEITQQVTLEVQKQAQAQMQQKTIESIQKLQQQINQAAKQKVSQSTPHFSYVYFLAFLRNQSIQQEMQKLDDIHKDYINIFYKDDLNAGHNHQSYSLKEQQQILKQSFTSRLDCSVFHRDALRLEYYACYNFTFHNYNAVIVWSVIVILAFLFLLVMFWVLKRPENTQEKIQPVYTNGGYTDVNGPVINYNNGQVNELMDNQNQNQYPRYYDYRDGQNLDQQFRNQYINNSQLQQSNRLHASMQQPVYIDRPYTQTNQQFNQIII